MSNTFEKEHRIASYNKGCKCDECMEANRLARRAQRRRQRAADPTYTVGCWICGDSFLSHNGLQRHIGAVHPRY